ncbi:DUF4968 domain-containing protein [Ruoffia tabacinasalis]|uniref:DUF4968 domain-containing protein n=1 Tax=Ruoffia tabacinasalis TaxID=87458 RepID=A0A5R9DXV0_9LACT|nr:TIM-barrel domain-containing protein [Ruoffia tabacinasalis]TLQ39871.1 DUF4968 domain-containing protein [Ruoffia tabacinasalis]
MHKTKYSQFDPVAYEDSIVQGENYRFTILTSKLVRIEYSENNIFEDAQTKMVLNRKFKTPEFDVFESENHLKIVTKDLIIKYNKKEFSPYGLSVELNGEVNHPYRGVWHYGDETKNLGGTARTLDFIDGKTELEPGLMSKYGISVINDTNTPILLEDGWFKERESNQEDIYVFGYKTDYLEALNDYYLLTGPQPKLPRYALGNWWSRYYQYSEESYLNLLDSFYEERIPFSVAVIDMDWHLVDIPSNYGSKWTGFTWNRKLFPNPERFLTALKNRNFATTLNIHPAAGIRPFEKMYSEMARDLDVDWEHDEYIDFMPYSKKFMDASFKYIYHPNEKIGVDFWWIDWQQGPQNINDAEDPLWILNHYHFGDNQKNENLGITFSRYSGPGSHRYPIGFSGDTVISWDSLDFQPYFTATASNIGYGWWSHDIGGHRHGVRDDELMLRWIQFGVFSPINRLHSANSEFLVKEPWNYSAPYSELMSEYLRLRHKLIPYIYSMNVLSNESSLPLIQPMYYKHSDDDNSFEVPNQYYFGSELIVCPITQKVDKESLKGHFKMWLPEGKWYDLQSGLRYDGDRLMNIYRSIENMGLFIKEGSIIPLANLDNFTNSIDNPKKVDLIIGYGSSGEFILREDFTGKEKVEKGALTKINFNQSDKRVIINPTKGNLKAIPRTRSWKLKIYGAKIDRAEIKVDDKKIEVNGIYNSKLNSTDIEIPEYAPEKEISIAFKEIHSVDSYNFRLDKIMCFLQQAQMSNLDKESLLKICKSNKKLKHVLSEIGSFEASDSILNAIQEILLA